MVDGFEIAFVVIARPIAIEAQNIAVELRQTVLPTLLRQDQTDARVFKHQSQTLFRIIEIERKVRAPGLQHTEYSN
jgi:hypothetical protein